MTTFTIPDSTLDAIKDKAVLITGASSGIGLATVRRVLKHGGKVFASDLNDLPEPECSFVPFMKVDVTSWKQQVEMFKAAEYAYGKIDHVFANAGIGPSFSLLEDDVDENGDLLPPKLNTVNVNLLGCIYTVKLGIHYMKNSGGSIVMTASVSSFSRFPATDYTLTKHAVLGLLRALTPALSTRPLRINAIAPSWTATGIVPHEVITALGEAGHQTADVPARSAVCLMVDEQRHGELVYSDRGSFLELENGERGYQKFTKTMLEGEEGDDRVGDDLKEFNVLKDLRRASKEKVEKERQMKESKQRDKGEGNFGLEGTVETVQ